MYNSGVRYDKDYKCPTCDIQISVDNSVNEQQPFCSKCGKYFTWEYLEGFLDGYEKAKDEQSTGG